jgi:hypothetical protein
MTRSLSACGHGAIERPHGAVSGTKENAAMSDIDDYLASYERHQKALAETNILNKQMVFDALSGAGITSVAVTFDGEGDSGQIEEITACKGEEPCALPESPIPALDLAWGATDPRNALKPLREAIEALCYDYLSQKHGGWENNDGAYGEFMFHVGERRIELDMYTRFTDSTNHTHTF